MIDQNNSHNTFFNKENFELSNVKKIISDALHKTEDGDLFLEQRQSESLSWVDGRIKSSSFDNSQGFGLRGLLGESRAYAHSSSLDIKSLKKAAETIKAINSNNSNFSSSPTNHSKKLYSEKNPVDYNSFSSKV